VFESIEAPVSSSCWVARRISRTAFSFLEKRRQCAHQQANAASAIESQMNYTRAMAAYLEEPGYSIK